MPDGTARVTPLTHVEYILKRNEDHISSKLAERIFLVARLATAPRSLQVSKEGCNYVARYASVLTTTSKPEPQADIQKNITWAVDSGDNTLSNRRTETSGDLLTSQTQPKCSCCWVLHTQHEMNKRPKPASNLQILKVRTTCMDICTHGFLYE